MLPSLRERVNSYREISDYKLLPKLPIITVVNGRQFRKITSLLEKPFDVRFVELMAGSAIKLMHEIDGSMFAFAYSDEIIVVSRNDQTVSTEPYYDGKIQKISSITASVATLEFSRLAARRGIELFGEPVFTSECFVVPNVMEAVNYIISKQQRAFYIALYQTCYYLMSKSYDPNRVKDILDSKTLEEKIEILKDDFGRDFMSEPSMVQRGIGLYRMDKVFDGGVKRKLTVDMELPLFAKDIEFLVRVLDGRN